MLVGWPATPGWALHVPFYAPCGGELYKRYKATASELDSEGEADNIPAF